MSNPHVLRLKHPLMQCNHDSLKHLLAKSHVVKKYFINCSLVKYKEILEEECLEEVILLIYTTGWSFLAGRKGNPDPGLTLKCSGAATHQPQPTTYL